MTHSLVNLRALALLASGTLPLVACGSNVSSTTSTSMRSAALAEGESCVNLFAGKSIDVGSVCVTVDSTVDTSAECGAGSTGVMSVTYTTSSGWTLVDTHLAVGDSLSDLPVNKRGNPTIGLFPYATTGMVGATTHTVLVPLCELGMDGNDDVCEPVAAQIAAHAVVKNDADTRTQTAWGDGMAFGGGSWAEHFSVGLECQECNDDAGEDTDALDPLAALTDEFDGDLASWDIYNPLAASVWVADSALDITPAALTQWYGTDEAVHVSKEVSGNFMITTHMTVTDLMGGSVVWGDPYRIGGILLRDPAGGPNTVHVGIGRMTDDWMSAVTKSTDDGQSTVGTIPWLTGATAELRLCRVGDDVHALIRMPGEEWTIINQFSRPDLPGAVAAGPMAYAGSPTADLKASAEWVCFKEIECLAECSSDD